MSSLPSTMKAVVIGKAEGKPGQVYHPIQVKEVPTPQIKEGDGKVIVKIYAAGLNHREIWLRKSLYPGLQFGSVLGADGAGVLVAPSSHPLYQKPVLLSPSVGWKSSRFGPDDPTRQHGILGGVKQTEGRGTFGEYIALDGDDVVALPAHLLEKSLGAKSEDGQDITGWDLGAALPLAAVTAYRATFTKAEVEKGQNVLITGIGGGVALQALQFAVGAGANVYVTSGSPEKLERAKQLGAKGGVSYKEENWTKNVIQLLPKDRPYFDAIIDSGGGNVITPLVRNLKDGARIVTYGQTTQKPHTLTMAEVLKNIEVKGSTMGSFAEFKSAIEFIDEHKIVPVVDHVYKKGLVLDEVEALFDRMKSGSQFGKLVLSISESETPVSRGEQGQKGKL